MNIFRQDLRIYQEDCCFTPNHPTVWIWTACLVVWWVAEHRTLAAAAAFYLKWTPGGRILVVSPNQHWHDWKKKKKEVKIHRREFKISVGKCNYQRCQELEWVYSHCVLPPFWKKAKDKLLDVYVDVHEAELRPERKSACAALNKELLLRVSELRQTLTGSTEAFTSFLKEPAHLITPRDCRTEEWRERADRDRQKNQKNMHGDAKTWRKNRRGDKRGGWRTFWRRTLPGLFFPTNHLCLWTH